jgi:hypothetical protein
MVKANFIDLPERKFSFENLYEVEGYYTFKVSVTSDNFSGASSFCISKEDMKSFLAILETLLATLKGSAELKDYDSDAYIKISMANYGNLTLSGQIGGSYEKQFMKFNIYSDQTILDLMSKYFSKILLLNKKYERSNYPLEEV